VTPADALAAIVGFLFVTVGVAMTLAIGPALIVAGALLIAPAVVKWWRVERRRMIG